jgi:hypothetical protein
MDYLANYKFVPVRNIASIYLNISVRRKTEYKRDSSERYAAVQKRTFYDVSLC